jgi:N-acetylneuraminate synthase
MVDSAASVGCEIIKHQTHFVDDEMTPLARTIRPPNADKSIYEVISGACLSANEEAELKQYSEKLGLIYISTPFSRKAADFLNEIGVPAFKIGSGECTHYPLLQHIATFGKPVIMSTGMASIQKLRKSVDIFKSGDIPLILLQCTNLYPSPPEMVSLKGIDELKSAFPDLAIGFSDHSIGPEMALAALGRGAVLIERHFTDSRYRAGPDISCSMDSLELALLIRKSREIHLALKNSKHRTEPEQAVFAFAHPTVVADRDIKQGEILDECNIWARRPGLGEISVEMIHDLYGRKVTRDIQFNEHLAWADLD